MRFFDSLRTRYNPVVAFILFFLLTSALVRAGLFIITLDKSEAGLLSSLLIFLKGLVFDFGVAVFFSLVLSIYLLILPSKWQHSKIHYVITYGIIFLMLLIAMFSFFAEFTFWQEFESRFNFIAVDYLIYTFEVISNINESYPLPLLIGSMIALTSAVLFLFIKTATFSRSFNSSVGFRHRLGFTTVLLMLAGFYITYISNSWADTQANRYQNELSKAGVYSFFAAFRNNELNYQDFYALMNEQKAFKLMRDQLKEPESHFYGNGSSIYRSIDDRQTGARTRKPNVIMITIESFSADFMAHFGNQEGLTPVLDSIADKSILFTNMYATGTRTVRGMEALSLAVPPTPGNSIVRRQKNENLTTIGDIFRQNGYSTTFFYGGDGYFDNMNQYFSSNGFDIVDRGRNMSIGDHYKTKRTIIPDDKVQFENAWGICDEDLYSALIRDVDLKYKTGKPFYNFVMTTSNHRPFTYPDGKISIPSGTGRQGAVQYTDYAIGQFLKAVRNKPWYKNTVIIFVADHCASSAGKNEIDIAKYHIPCLIYNLPEYHELVDKMCSQIDLYPTLFGILGWKYESNLYGLNVLNSRYEPRVVLGTYQKLAFMKKDSLVILGPQQKIETYIYDKKANLQQPAQLPGALIEEAVAYYQTAYSLYKRGGLKINRKMRERGRSGQKLAKRHAAI